MISKFDFCKVKILVIGDVMLDKYYYGSVERISPEAPIPILKVSKKTSSLGGAANVANNVISLKAQVLLFGLIGDDFNGNEFKNILENKKIESHLLELDMPTITKSRIVANKNQQLVRLDFEENLKLTTKNTQLIKTKIINLLPLADIIIISDYAKGLINKEICTYIIDEAKKADKKVIIDPKKDNWELYKNAFLITPNFQEFKKATGANIANTDEEIELYGKKLIKNLNLTYLLVTRSEKGMSLISKNTAHHFKAIAQEVYDVSGAGDTVIATLAVTAAKGFDILTACDLSNKAAGIVVRKSGTAPIALNELEDTLIEAHEENKIVELPLLLKKINGRKIAFIDGIFDSCGKKTIEFLRKIKNQIDFLIIGLHKNPDATKLEDKIFLLAALELIDFIIVLDPEELPEIIQIIKPDVYYTEKNIKGEIL
ncbi:MAG: D-glycero-beta-D-manno-heptose-7-phosphate kinase [Candidatus Margulisiibacteriota bacterium]|jgi:D-beta-D-heptose 7-phosphate kinase/D-beta-D-heptose 1-phosphate adenosyltransferase